MSWCRFFVVAALYYGFQSFQRIFPRRKSSFEGKKDDYSGKVKVKKILAQGGGDSPKVVAEAAIKWFFIEETSKPPATKKQLRFETLLLAILSGCAGLLMLIRRRNVRKNQDQIQAGSLPLNISPEESLRIFLTGEAGQILNVEEFLTALDLHQYFAILHGAGYHTMIQLLHASYTDLMEAGLEEVSPSGWSEGECRGRNGWFPSAYVERRQRLPTTNGTPDFY